MEKVKEITQKAKVQAKEAIHGDTHHDSTHTGAHTSHTGAHNTSTNAGPHDSNIANKADPRVDSDFDGSRNLGAAGNTTHTGTHGTHHTGTTHGTHHTGAGYGGSTNAGPHDSNLANKADPRVDSDLDGSRNLGAAGNTTHTGTTHGTHQTGAGYAGAGHTGAGYGNMSANAGPHNSSLANKADPRVDSDLDGSRNLGVAGNTTHTGHAHGTHHTGTHTGAHTGTHTGTHHGHAGNVGNPQSTNAGPHGSNLLNKADPRVDSDLDGSRNLGATSHNTTHTGGAGGVTAGYGQTGGTHTGAGYAGNTNTYGNSTNAGPHDSNLANKADPRVDSDLDGSRNLGGAHTGTTGHNTTHTGSTNAGPHNSNILNKLDPRVDSDRDGSRNAGAATY